MSVKAKLLERLDGWSNIVTGLGMAGKDKRVAAAIDVTRLSFSELEALARNDDMAARIVEIVPDAILREGWEFAVEDKTVAESVMALCDELEVDSKLHEAMCSARVFGSALLYLRAVDGQTDMSKPLAEDRIQSVGPFSVFTPQEVEIGSYYSDIASPLYGKPETYRVRERTFTGTVGPNASVASISRTADRYIHESRVIRFDGVRLTSEQLYRNRGWGDSVLLRVHDVIRDYQTSWSGAAVLLQDFSQSVFKLKGLAEALERDADDLVVKRAQVIDLLRSITRGIIIDSEEEWERKTTSIAGLPEMLQQFGIRLAAAARVPVTLLLGQSPAGLNATGESDIRFFYDSVAVEQERMLRPRLNRLLEVLLHSRTGPTGGREPENWTVRFNPLWQLTELQMAELRAKQAATDAVYLTNGVVTPEEIAVSRFGGDDYSSDTQLDWDARDELGKPIVEAEAPEVAPEGEAVVVTESATSSVTPAPRVDYDPSQPRDNDGKWGEGGGGGSSSSSGGGKSERKAKGGDKPKRISKAKAEASSVNARLKEIMSKPPAERARILAEMKASTEAAKAETVRLKAYTRELRGIRKQVEGVSAELEKGNRS